MILKCYDIKKIIILWILILPIYCYGQSELLELNGFKVEILTAGLENNTKNKAVIVFENGRGSSFALYPDETQTIYDCEKMYSIDSNIRIMRWMELLYPLTYGKFFYSSSLGHTIQEENGLIVIFIQ